jgi:hypothetical protein
MHWKTRELRERLRRFAAGTARLCDRLPIDPGAQRVGRKLRVSSQSMMTGYTDVCAAPSAERFISAISAVAIHAKRARASLQLLLQLNHLTIADARDLMIEARAFEAIFVKSRNTAKRRHRDRPAWNSPVARRLVARRSDAAAANHVDQPEDNRDDEQDVQRAAQRVLGDDAEQPQNHQNRDDDEHGTLPPR